MKPLQPILSFMKPSTHTAQLKRGFSYFQDLIRKHIPWWAKPGHTAASPMGCFLLPHSNHNLRKNSDTQWTNVQSGHQGSWIPISTNFSKKKSVKMCRGHIQQNHIFHNLSLIALANLQTKYRQTLSRSVLPYFHQHQWSSENWRQQRILHQKSTCHPSQNLTLQSTLNKSSLHSPNAKYLFSLALHCTLKDNGNHTVQMFRQEDRLSRAQFWCSLQALNA